MNNLRQYFKWTSFIIYILCWSLSSGQTGTEATSIHQSIQHRTNAIFDSLVNIRRDLHQNPELGGREKRTSDYIRQYLLDLGLEVKSEIGGYGVVGILNGNKKGPKIAWRADIDALETSIPESVEFASKNEGIRHICGHDVHTTIALGMANVLASQKERINGTIYFLFQPSEENYKGAKAMINDGLFDVISPDEMYAAHISPMPSGMVATKSDYLYADYKQVNLTFKKNTQSDSVSEFTEKIISDLQNVAPDSKFWDTRNLMDPAIGIGNPNTIFKEYIIVNSDFTVKQKNGELIISTVLSASNKEIIDSIPRVLQQQIEESKFADQLKDISYSSERFIYSPERGNIQNDKHLTEQTLRVISGIYGKSSAIPLFGVIPDGRGDDFAYFQEKVPGVYFLLGGSDFEKGIIAMPHSPNFAVDEACIKTGVKYFSSMIVERVNQ